MALQEWDAGAADDKPETFIRIYQCILAEKFKYCEDPDSGARLLHISLAR